MLYYIEAELFLPYFGRIENNVKIGPMISSKLDETFAQTCIVLDTG